MIDRRAILAATLGLMCVTLAFHGEALSAETHETPKKEYKAGQVWSYTTRPGEEQSVLTVLKVESDAKLGQIVHIHLQGLHVKNPRASKGYLDFILYLPFAEDACNRSVIKLLRTVDTLPDFQDAYQHWRDGVTAGQAGIYTLTVAEAIDVIERAINSSAK